MIRAPIVAGQFYPASISSLKGQLSKLCLKADKKEDAIGLLLPHAGYIYSGRVAGETVSKTNLKDIFVIIGPNHSGMGECFSLDIDEAWQTPLGKINVNLELASEILKNSSHLKKDSKAHSFEHSIEVQLPFLQHTKGKTEFTIVPIVASIGKLEIYKQIGVTIASAIKKLGLLNRAQIIASSDMTHYEEANVARDKDNKALDALLKLSPDSLLAIVEKENISMCGYIPAVIMLAAVRNMGAKQAKLIMYENSGDTTKDYSSVVGYAGVIIS